MNLHRFSLAAGISGLAMVIATPAIAGELQGTVFDNSNTVALNSAQVRIVELDRTANAQGDGSFVFGAVPAGTYTVIASYVGAQQVEQKVKVPETGSVRADFLLGGDQSQILVVGQYANQASALSRKKAADGVEDVLTRDAIGQFPDQNAAESLRRLPGINILNDQGEGRFVSVRGLDPNLNATSLNGVRLPAPESDVRQVALDVISSDVIESIEVKKSLTPDMDADTIGASIEINTTSAFDRKKDYYAVRAEGSYNDYSGKVTPKGSFDFSKRLGEDFGIAGGISYYKREFETDNVESDPWAQVNGGAPYSEVLEFRDYDVKRTRISAALSLDWRASDTTKAYIRGNWSQFDDHEYRRRTTFDLTGFEDDGPSSSRGDTVTFNTADNDITVERDLKDRFERQRIRSVVIGSDTDTGTWKFDWAASYAKSSERENWSLDPVRFASDFDDSSGVVLAFDNSGKHYAARTALIDRWDAERRADPAASRIILTHLNKEVAMLNEAARARLAEQGELGRDFAVCTERGLRDFADNDRILFLKNERDLGVKNGTLGTVERAAADTLAVRLDDGRRIAVDLKSYAHIDHGYAATVHKTQGMTVDRTHVLATPGMDAHSAYVALSRHRSGIAIHYGRDDFADEKALRQTLGRERPKDNALDFRQAGQDTQAATVRANGTVKEQASTDMAQSDRARELRALVAARVAAPKPTAESMRDALARAASAVTGLGRSRDNGAEL